MSDGAGPWARGRAAESATHRWAAQWKRVRFISQRADTRRHCEIPAQRHARRTEHRPTVMSIPASLNSGRNSGRVCSDMDARMAGSSGAASLVHCCQRTVCWKFLCHVLTRLLVTSGVS